MNFNNYLMESINKLNKIIEDFRKTLENDYDWQEDKMCMKGTCQSVTKELVDLLNKNGYNAKRVNGRYMNISDDFEPDMSQWSDEDIEEWTPDMGMNHWWVEIGDKIVDVTADQFHPKEEDDYRIIITNKSNRDYE